MPLNWYNAHKFIGRDKCVLVGCVTDMNLSKFFHFGFLKWCLYVQTVSPCMNERILVIVFKKFRSLLFLFYTFPKICMKEMAPYVKCITNVRTKQEESGLSLSMSVLFVTVFLWSVLLFIYFCFFFSISWFIKKTSMQMSLFESNKKKVCLLLLFFVLIA